MSEVESGYVNGERQRSTGKPLRVLLIVRELFPGSPSVPL